LSEVEVELPDAALEGGLPVAQQRLERDENARQPARIALGYEIVFQP
jgi:hypothetical protein